MNWFNNLKFSLKVIIGFSLVIVLAVVSSVVSVVYMGKVDKASEAAVLSEQLVQTALQGGIDRRDFLSTGQKKFADNTLHSPSVSIGILDDILTLVSNEELADAVDGMKNMFPDYLVGVQDIIDAKTDMDAAFSAWGGLGDQFMTLVNQLKEQYQDSEFVVLQLTELEAAFYTMEKLGVYYSKVQTEEVYPAFLAGLEGVQAEMAAISEYISSDSVMLADFTPLKNHIAAYLVQADRYHQAVVDQNAAAAVVGSYAQYLNGSADPASQFFGGTKQISALLNQEMQNAENMAKTIQFIIIAIVVLLGLAITFILVSTTTKPLNLLVKAGDGLAIGDTSVGSDAQSQKVMERKDEFGILANSFKNIIVSQIQMTKAFERMANGDLTVEFKPRSEKDTMGIAFVKMTNDLRALMTKLTNTARGLTEASAQLAKASEQAGQATQQIASTSQQVASGAGDQSTALQETTRAIDQLSTAIEQISRGAQEQSKGIEKTLITAKEVAEAAYKATSDAKEASNSSAESARVAKNGAEMVQQTVEGMGKIREAIGSTSQKITRLGEQSAEIDKIVATIDDIAAQTNLLALNAAIEAARAGEQGRGFAVVADEVRKLAERSLKATKEIADLIIGIQNGVNDAVKAMEDSTSYVENGYKMASDSGKSMTEILKYAEGVGQGVDNISVATGRLSKLGDELLKVMEEISSVVEENTAATQQMAASSDQVSKSIESVAGVAEENGAATEEVSASAEEMSAQVEEVVASAQSLSGMADELSSAVSVFRLN
jgi:methyl-accepting chemotaxis protein